MVWNPLTGPLADPWAALALSEVDSVIMKADITDNFNAIQTVLVSQPLGYVAGGKTTGSGNYSTSATVIGSGSFAYVSGRQYLIFGYFQGVQNTGTGIVNVALGGTGIPADIAWLASVGAGVTAYGSVVGLFAPSSSGSTTANLVASTSANTITIATGATIAVIDLGT